MRVKDPHQYTAEELAGLWVPAGREDNAAQWRILAEVCAERDRQDVKWGDQSRLSRERLLCALMEEVGEAAEAILGNGERRNLREELVQIAALTVQMIEHEDAKGAVTP